VSAIPAPVHSDEEVLAWFDAVVLPTKEVWVTEEAGGILAVLVLEDDWIDQLYVDPDHVGHGIGRELMAVAKARRPGGLRLWTFAANARARRFYERHGFAITTSTDGDNEEGAPDICYEWVGHEPVAGLGRPSGTGPDLEAG
jgi:GNAT superfamily N-acetyltransferase